MASKLLESVGKITIFQRFGGVPHQNSEEKKLEDWEKCLKWLKSLNIRSAKVPSLDFVNSDNELYHYLKVCICYKVIYLTGPSYTRMGQSSVE